MKVLVPFPGFLYLYALQTFLKSTAKKGSRPLPGVLISLRYAFVDYKTKEPGSRPLPGVLISLHSAFCSSPKFNFVLVPFPGFLYLYWIIAMNLIIEKFSSPSRGSYISTNAVIINGVSYTLFSSPSRGSYISTLKIAYRKSPSPVLVPFPGFLYLYASLLFRKWRELLFSSPSRGSYISTWH